ncbi:MAG TPA: hypothetical protein VE965_00490 [Gammaproteobacteria bacterium]|jgi:PHD/YefM family antitoxin component YafN of YafNO toxin-antitoxin module|nr:hypothetical protein [Gammaproteobacteria bacterium]
MPIIEARKKLTSFPEVFAQEPELGAVAVTRRGKPVLAVMLRELYEALIETFCRLRRVRSAAAPKARSPRSSALVARLASKN